MFSRELDGMHPAGARLDRETVTVEGVAARLEHRLHWPHMDQERLAEGCAFAQEASLAAVLCRPKHVKAAAAHLTGSPVDVVTALGYHDRHSPRRSAELLAQEAEGLAQQGADEVGLITGCGSRPDADLDLLTEQLRAVTAAVSHQACRVRVLLNTEGLTDSEISSACRRAADAGAHLLQGGSFRGDRTPLGHIETMRAALPSEVRLKWTHPVRSLEVLLVCIALGVDRFNGDPHDLLAAAARSSRIAPLMVPIPGVDF
jgi:deoxyribose-phosphate aldolase